MLLTPGNEKEIIRAYCVLPYFLQEIITLLYMIAGTNETDYPENR